MKPNLSEQEAANLSHALAHFTGSDELYKHWLGFQYTDGVKYLADQAQCYWLIDLIGSYQPKLKNENSQLWIVVVGSNHPFIKPKPGKDAVITCWNKKPDPNVKPLLAQHENTDFPFQEFKLYLKDKILLLPSES
ncbi:MAG TPA: hypothetical protein VK203_19655 [Nostocaceae cyanobacterium]|nr:hypothetical protein [Nostocaceae cyanobacterium]